MLYSVGWGCIIGEALPGVPGKILRSVSTLPRAQRWPERGGRRSLVNPTQQSSCADRCLASDGWCVGRGTTMAAHKREVASYPPAERRLTKSVTNAFKEYISLQTFSRFVAGLWQEYTDVRLVDEDGAILLGQRRAARIPLVRGLSTRPAAYFGFNTGYIKSWIAGGIVCLILCVISDQIISRLVTDDKFWLMAHRIFWVLLNLVNMWPAYVVRRQATLEHLIWSDPELRAMSVNRIVRRLLNYGIDLPRKEVRQLKDVLMLARHMWTLREGDVLAPSNAVRHVMRATLISEIDRMLLQNAPAVPGFDVQRVRAWRSEYRSYIIDRAATLLMVRRDVSEAVREINYLNAHVEDFQARL